MKIMFVHQGREHLGIEYLSSVLKKEGHETALACDPGLFGPEDNVFYSPFLEKIFNNKEKVLGKIREYNSELLVFSVYTSTYRWACDIARTIKPETDAKIVFGGIHASLVPEKVIQEDFVDFVIVGEGEDALAELAEEVKGLRTKESVSNLWYKKGRQVMTTPVKPPVRDLDDLPFPDKEIFKEYVNFRDDYITMTSRGCVFSCSFCCESYFHKLYHGKYFRRRSVGSMISELAAMKDKYGFRRVMFFDSILFVDRKWLKEFLEEYKKEIAVPFRCAGYVDFAEKENIRAMKEAGCYAIDFGVETFNARIRKEILNRDETNEQIHEAFALCDEFRIRYDVDLMMGLPLMKESDYKDAVRFMGRHGYFNRLKCYNLAYYPRMPIVSKAQELGLLDAKEVEKIDQGHVGDWFHRDDIKDIRHKEWKDNFEKFYKLYPLIPPACREYLLKGKRYRIFRFVPGFIVVFGQLLIGAWKRDYRFYIYINNYFQQIKRALFR
ncbi:MAG: radical SAM protein [Candidatus Tantalella remota]|nr:radical SAM protein [Candidatus Tantalella remota]